MIYIAELVFQQRHLLAVYRIKNKKISFKLRGVFP